MRYSAGLAAVVLAACSGNSGGTSGPAVAPVLSSAQAMRDFMKAAADSNLMRMGQLWGTSRGSAAETQYPENYEKRLVVLQLYLRADSSKIASDVAIGGKDDQREVKVDIYRQGCKKQVPALMIRLDNKGWIVNNIDLAPAGNPARPCEPA
jgi:hypothetical protein